MGRLDEASASLHRAIELNPDLVFAYTNLYGCAVDEFYDVAPDGSDAA